MRKNGRFDYGAQKDLVESVNDWATYQNLAGDADNVETSPITGHYDWRSYLREEAEIAHRREQKTRARDRKPERPSPPPAPTHLYA